MAGDKEDSPTKSQRLAPRKNCYVLLHILEVAGLDKGTEQQALACDVRYNRHVEAHLNKAAARRRTPVPSTHESHNIVVQVDPSVKDSHIEIGVYQGDELAEEK